MAVFLIIYFTSSPQVWYQSPTVGICIICPFFFFLLPLVINDQCQSGWPWQCGSFCVYLDLAKTLMLVFSEVLCLWGIIEIFHSQNFHQTQLVFVSFNDVDPFSVSWESLNTSQLSVCSCCHKGTLCLFFVYLGVAVCVCFFCFVWGGGYLDNEEVNKFCILFKTPWEWRANNFWNAKVWKRMVQKEI